MDILEQIRIARECKDLSQADLAKKIHISPASYGKLERGENEMGIKMLVKIAKALKMEVSDLLSISGKTPCIKDNQADHQSNIVGRNTVSHFNYYYVCGDKEIEHLTGQLKHQNDLIVQKDELLKQQAEQLKILNDTIILLQKQISK